MLLFAGSAKALEEVDDPVYDGVTFVTPEEGGWYAGMLNVEWENE